jgi:hypothetical protein
LAAQAEFCPAILVDPAEVRQGNREVLPWTCDEGGVGAATIARVVDSVEIGVKRRSMRVFLGDSLLKHNGEVKGFVVIDGVYVEGEGCIVDNGAFTQKGGIKVEVASVAAVIVCTAKDGSEAKIGNLSHAAAGSVELSVTYAVRGCGGYGGVNDDAFPYGNVGKKEKKQEETYDT